MIIDDLESEFRDLPTSRENSGYIAYADVVLDDY